MQRFFDIFFSGLALIILAPILIPIMIILRFTGEGEIFYIQQRVGKSRNMFGLLKFATMLKNSPDLGTGTITVKGDPRVLPFGKFLRKSKINELPQLLNILKGDMSVIGPRPQDIRCFIVFDDIDQRNIKEVRPGLSGIGSIIFRDEESLLDGEESLEAKEDFYDNVISPYKGKVESWYVEHQSLKLYFQLIWLTVVAVLMSDKMVNLEEYLKDFPKAPKILNDKWSR